MESEMDGKQLYKKLTKEIKAIRKEANSTYMQRVKMEKAIDTFYADPELSKDAAMNRLDALKGSRRWIDIFSVTTITSVLMAVVTPVALEIFGILESTHGLNLKETFIVFIMAFGLCSLLLWLLYVVYALTNEILWIHEYERDYELKVLEAFLRENVDKDKN